MQFLAVVAFLVLMTMLDAPSRADETLCAAAWDAADLDRDGVLDGREATSYLATMSLHGIAWPADGRIDRRLFLERCAAGALGLE